MEDWRDIPGYEGHYQVSDEGRVKSLIRWRCPRERILKPGDDGRGYPKVNLLMDRKLKTFKIHRLVATMFIPNPFSLPQVNHRDSNKWNNHVSNLERCTKSYNERHAANYRRLSGGSA